MRAGCRARFADAMHLLACTSHAQPPCEPCTPTPSEVLAFRGAWGVCCTGLACRTAPTQQHRCDELNLIACAPSTAAPSRWAPYGYIKIVGCNINIDNSTLRRTGLTKGTSALVLASAGRWHAEGEQLPRDLVPHRLACYRTILRVYNT